MASSRSFSMHSLESSQEYLPSTTAPTGTDPLAGSLRQDRLHGIPDHDHATHTQRLLDNNSSWNSEGPDSVALKEQTIVRQHYDPPKRSESFHLRDWQWELAAAVFSLLCVVAIIIILKVYQERSLSSWHFVHDITLNTVVALLSTLSRTALIVPVASCLSQLKWIHLVTSPRPLREMQIFDDASRGPWGSLELIWRLHFKTKLATWGSLITILSLTMGPLSQQLLSYPSRLHFNNSGATFYRNQVYDSGVTRGVYGWRDLGGNMDPKIQGAILNGLYNLSAPIQVECQTGNCQWDDFTTLAVASNCTDVTSASHIICHDIVGRACNYTTPAGFFIKSSSNTTSGRSTEFNSTARIQRGVEEVGTLLNSSIVSFATANMVDSMKSPRLTECDMRWVGRRVRNMTVVNGTFNPGIMQDHELYGIVNPFDKKFWVSFSVSNETTTLPGNTTFSVGPTDNSRMMKFLSDIFSSSQSDPYGLALSSSTNLTQTVEAISTSMTYAFGEERRIDIKLRGRTITTEQYIKVHWAWISVPVVEVVMGIAFFAATLVHTWRRGVVAWKSSAIVPLMTHIEGWRIEESRMGSAREVEKRAREMKGLLERDDDGGQRFKRMDI